MMGMLRLSLSLSGVFLFAVASRGAADSPTFNKDVLPIVQKNCQACHPARPLLFRY
jgi:hypothetical protein